MWRNILAKVVKDNNPTITLDFAEVEMLMKFLKTTDEPSKFFNTILLHDTICQLYPGEEEEEWEVFWWKDLSKAKRSVIVSCSPQPHHVSVLGQKLLALTDGQGFRHIVKAFKLGHYTMVFSHLDQESQSTHKSNFTPKSTPTSKIIQKYTKKSKVTQKSSKPSKFHYKC